jgi:NADH:ubiquinone oxidoreductase subunit 6 (subunit J)
MDPRQTAETFNTLTPILFWILALATGFCAIATVIAQNIVRSATWLLFTLAGTSGVFFLLGADLVGVTQLLVYVGGTLVLVIFGVMLTAQGPFISMKSSGAEWAISVVAGFLLLAVLATAVLTPNVLVGPPLIKATEAMDIGDKKGEMRSLYRSPDAKRYAPPFSRAERQIIGARNSPAGADPKDLKKGGGPGLPPAGPPKGEPKAGVGAVGAPQALQEVKRELPSPIDPATSNQSAILGQGFIGVPVGPAHPSGNRIVRANYLLPFEIVSVHLLVVLIRAAYLARAKRRRGGVS